MASVQTQLGDTFSENILWQPQTDQVQATAMYQFMQDMNTNTIWAWKRTLICGIGRSKNWRSSGPKSGITLTLSVKNQQVLYSRAACQRLSGLKARRSITLKTCCATHRRWVTKKPSLVSMNHSNGLC